jgi:hypothetical protein
VHDRLWISRARTGKAVSPQAVDNVCCIVAAALPILLVLRWNLLGVALGALVVWGTLIGAGMLLSALDPRREAGLLDAIWLMFGWIFGLIYCLGIDLAKWFAIGVWRSTEGNGS